MAGPAPAIGGAFGDTSGDAGAVRGWQALHRPLCGAFGVTSGDAGAARAAGPAVSAWPAMARLHAELPTVLQTWVRQWLTWGAAER